MLNCSLTRLFSLGFGWPFPFHPSFYTFPVFLYPESTVPVFYLHEKQNIRKISRRIKSSTTDLRRIFLKNTSKSLTNLANTVWVLVVMVILLILSSNNIYHLSRRSQSGSNSLISSFFFYFFIWWLRWKVSSSFDRHGCLSTPGWGLKLKEYFWRWIKILKLL